MLSAVFAAPSAPPPVHQTKIASLQERIQLLVGTVQEMRNVVNHHRTTTATSDTAATTADAATLQVGTLTIVWRCGRVSLTHTCVDLRPQTRQTNTDAMQRRL